MKFETILKCTEKAKINYQYSQTTRDCERYYRQFKTFHAWLLHHDEKQRAEIKDHEEGFELYRSGVEIMKTNYEEEIARLQAQVASMERIMERETEKNTKALNPYTKE